MGGREGEERREEGEREGRRETRNGGTDRDGGRREEGGGRRERQTEPHIRNGCIQSRYLEVGVRRWGTIPLHSNQPWWRKLLLALQW